MALTPSATGAISGSIRVNTVKEAVGPNPLVATQVGPPALTAFAPFTLLALASTCSTGVAPGCSLLEVITQTVSPDPAGITLTEPTEPGGLPSPVTMSAIILSGHVQTSTGNINPVTLLDNRGTLVGWSLTAQFQSDNFACAGNGGVSCPGSSPAHNTIPASNFLLKAPVVACADAGNPASLGPAAAGGGGGGFVVNSPVSLLVPPFIAAGTYSNTLNITVT